MSDISSGGASAVKEPCHFKNDEWRSENFLARSPGCTFFLKIS